MEHRNKCYQNVPFCDTMSHPTKLGTTFGQPRAMEFLSCALLENCQE